MRSSPDRRARGRGRSRARARAATRAVRATPRESQRGGGRALLRDRPPRAPRGHRAALRSRGASPRHPATRGGARSSSRNDATATGDRAPTNSETTCPSLNALTAGMPWTRNVAERPGFASTSTLASSTAPSRSATCSSSTGVSARHGPHQAAQKSTTTGRSCERSMTSLSKVASVTSTRRQTLRTVAGHSRDDDVSPAAREQSCGDVLGRDTCEGRDGRGRPRSPATNRDRASERRPRAPNSYSSSVENTPRRPVWRRAIPSSSRSSSKGSIRTFESEPMQIGIARVRTRSAGRKPSPRSASVVGHAQIVAPCEARRSSSAPSACVAWTTVVRSAEAARAREQLDRAAAVLREALLDLLRLLVRVDVEREPFGGRVGADLLEPVGGARAHGVGGDADADPGRRAAPRPVR